MELWVVNTIIGHSDIRPSIELLNIIFQEKCFALKHPRDHDYDVAAIFCVVFNHINIFV